MTGTDGALFHEVVVIAGTARRAWSAEEKARIVAETRNPPRPGPDADDTDLRLPDPDAQPVRPRRPCTLMESGEAFKAVGLSRVPMGRMLAPAEIAPLAVYLASSESDGMTGQTITISGGLRMG